MGNDFDEGEWVPTSEDETVLKRHQELFCDARKAGNYGPVDYDKPYPRSQKNLHGKSGPLAGNAASGDNPLESETR